MDTTTPVDDALRHLAMLPINDLVARHPETMPALSALGFDLCCGGSRQLGEAIDLHGLDRDSVLRQIGRILIRPALDHE